MTEQLRYLGMPIDLRLEKILLEKDYTICEEGK